MHRIIDISETGARLRIECGCLAIDAAERGAVRIPVREVAAVILAHPQITCTQAVLAEIATAGGVVITCDAKRQPSGLQFPLQSHCVQAERFLAQAQAKRPLCKRLWKQIVQAKIRIQGNLLAELRGGDAGLPVLAASVRSGDPANVEAQAARRYWRRLFSGGSFRRDRDAADQNRLLNYGYAVLRGITARACCAAGLHPSLGVHHRNRYNAFCLADDLLEPFRPAVDRIVAEVVERDGPAASFSRDTRGVLLSGLYDRWLVGDERRSLFEATEMLASSLADNFMGTRRRLVLPTRLEPAGAIPTC